MDNTQRETIYAGKLIKCPSCGQPISSYTAICPSCGFELNSARVSDTISDFTSKLSWYDAQIASSASGGRGNAFSPIEKQKAAFIENYRFPNEREAILDGLSYINEKVSALANMPGNVKNTYWLDVWVKKAEALFQNSMLLLGRDHIAEAKYTDIKEKHEAYIKASKVQKVKRKSKKAFIIIGAIVLGHLLLIALIFAIALGSGTGKELKVDYSIYTGKEDVFVSPSNDDIVHALEAVSEIDRTIIITDPEKDTNRILNDEKGGISVVIFGSTLVDKKSLQSDDLVTNGVDGGGNIELFATEKQARDRLDWLSNFSASGSCYRISNIIIRTSSKLKEEEQIYLTEKIIQSFIDISEGR